MHVVDDVNDESEEVSKTTFAIISAIGDTLPDA